MNDLKGIKKALKERPFKIVISKIGYRVRNNYLPLSSVKRHRIGNDGQWRLSSDIRPKIVKSYDKGDFKSVRKYVEWLLIVMDNNRTVNELNGFITDRKLPTIESFMNDLENNVNKMRRLER